MSDKMIMVLFNGFSLLILLVFQILTPRVARKNILLGVKIPEEEIKSENVKRIIKGFIKENLIVGIPALIVISFLIYLIENINVFIISVFLYMGILFLVYIRWNRKVKELKKEKGWDKLGDKVVVVDTKFSRDKEKVSSISKRWFLISLGIIIISAFLSFVRYPHLPDMIPSHWDLKGNIDGYMQKSIFAALMMPLVQVGMQIIMYLTYYFSIISKQQINPRDPETSLKKNIIFRKAWSIFFIVSLTLLQLLFTILNMMVLGIIKYSALINILLIIVVVITILGSAALSLVLGQGGDRLRLNEEGSTRGYGIDDDDLWKFGNTIYYNKNDPAIIVEKRVGVGWTVNAGKPIGMVIMILPIIIVIVTMLLIR